MAEDLAFLHKLRASLLAEAVATEQRLRGEQDQLAKEQADVARLREGVLGFLQSLASTDEMQKEQREAAEAAARVRETLAARNALYAKIDEVDGRIAAFDPVQVARETAARRAQIELAAIAGSRDQLLELDARIEAIDIELVALTDSVAAGRTALAELTDVIVAIDEAAREPVRAPVLQPRSARAMLGEAHAAIVTFIATLDSLPAVDDTTPRIVNFVTFDDRVSFVDEQVLRLLGQGPIQQRLADARVAVNARIDRLRALFDPVRERHAEVSQRRLAFSHQRERVRTTS